VKVVRRTKGSVVVQMGTRLNGGLEGGILGNGSKASLVAMLAFSLVLSWRVF
jgi:hypothetical protein